MRARYGLFEPATVVCAAVLLWPFLHVEFELLARLLTGPYPPNNPYAGYLLLAQLSIAIAIPLEAIVAYSITFLVCRAVHTASFPLSVRRISLATGLILTLVAGALLGLIITYELPLSSNYYSLVWIWDHTVPFVVILFGALLACEFRFGLQSVTTGHTISAEPARPVWARLTELLADNDEPTTREKLIYAIPLLALMLFVAASSFLVAAVPLRQMRLDLPLFVAWTVYFAGRGYQRLGAGLLILSGVYVLWISRSRRRMVIFAILLCLVLLVGAFSLLITIILPLIQIQCIVEGEAVDTPGGPRPIETLRVGEAILCCDAAGQRVAGRVDAIYVNAAAQYLKFELDGGLSLRVTAAHPLATPAGYRAARELKPGDAVLTRDGVRHIIAIQTVNAPVRVYDLSVTPHPNFYAAGVLVHNKLRKK